MDQKENRTSVAMPREPALKTVKAKAFGRPSRKLVQRRGARIRPCPPRKVREPSAISRRVAEALLELQSIRPRRKTPTCKVCGEATRALAKCGGCQQVAHPDCWVQVHTVNVSMRFCPFCGFAPKPGKCKQARGSSTPTPARPAQSIVVPFASCLPEFPFLLVSRFISLKQE